MKKDDIELIMCKVSTNNQCAIHMKIYKNGLICRSGVGGIPELGFSGIVFTNTSTYFDTLIKEVSQEIIKEPFKYEETTPNGYTEYILAFYGKSKNNETGESAEWSQSTGCLIKIDNQSTYQDPIIRFIDKFTLDAAELTNELYFDVVMQAVYKAQSPIVKNAIITCPPTEAAIIEHFSMYYSQMLESVRRWDISEYIKNKLYEIENRNHSLLMIRNENLLSIRFIPTKNLSPMSKLKKPFWQFW